MEMSTKKQHQIIGCMGGRKRMEGVHFKLMACAHGNVDKKALGSCTARA